MDGTRWLLTVALVLAAGIAWAADDVAVTEADDVGEAAGAAPIESRVTRDIDVDLIDLDRLREAVEGERGRDQVRLSLEQCVFLALENNQNILVTEYEPLKAAGDILAARGVFDPMLTSMATYLRASQQASPEIRQFGGIDSTEVYRTSSSTAVAGMMPWGTLYNLQFDLSKEETTWNMFWEEWAGSVTLSVAQPLLRGRRRAVNTARIRIAKRAEEAAHEQLRLVVMTTVADAIKAYWDLVGAIETVKVSQESLANAERLLDINNKRLAIGTAAAIEVLQAKAGVATRQSELIAARARVSDAEDALKHLLDMRESGLFSTKQIVPLDRPAVAGLDLDELAKSEAALEESSAAALEHRPEIALGQIEIEMARLDRGVAGDNLLPDFSVTGSLTQGGRDHFLRESFRGIRERRDKAYTVGFNASMPLGNRLARGTFQRADRTLHQAEKRLEKTKQELLLQVRLAARAVDTSQILVESNRQTRALQETNVVAEEKRLRLGVTTSYQVLQIQGDLTAAQTQEVQAQVAYEKALVDLRLAEGAILSALGIEFGAPEPERPVSYVRSVVPGRADFPGVATWVDKVRKKVAPRTDGPAD